MLLLLRVPQGRRGVVGQQGGLTVVHGGRGASPQDRRGGGGGGPDVSAQAVRLSFLALVLDGGLEGYGGEERRVRKRKGKKTSD